MRWRSAIGVGVAIGIGIERENALWHSATRSLTYAERPSPMSVGPTGIARSGRATATRRINSRALQAIALKSVEGQGPRLTAKRRTGDRRRSFEIARGSALECAAIQDVLPVCDAMSADDSRKQKPLLDRSVAELAKLGQRGDAIREELGEDGVGQFDTDTD